MRTTVTLDADTEQIVRRRMAARQQSFTRAVNDLIHTGASAEATPEEFRTRTFSMGPARVDLDRALHLAGDCEDEECVRRLSKDS